MMPGSTLGWAYIKYASKMLSYLATWIGYFYCTWPFFTFVKIIQSDSFKMDAFLFLCVYSQCYLDGFSICTQSV